MCLFDREYIPIEIYDMTKSAHMDITLKHEAHATTFHISDRNIHVKATQNRHWKLKKKEQNEISVNELAALTCI